MNCNVLEIFVYEEGKQQPTKIINAGPFPIAADECLESIDGYKWPLRTVPENLSDLCQQLFQPNQPVKHGKFDSMYALLDFFDVKRLVQLDRAERMQKVEKLMSPMAFENPFPPPVYRSAKPYVYAVLGQRATFGCDHLESGADFCPICAKNGDRRCLRCGFLPDGDFCTRCGMYLGHECKQCTGRHVSASCACEELVMQGAPACCSECGEALRANQLCTAKTCGCVSHWWCFIKDADDGKISCGKCGKQQIQDCEVAAVQVSRFYAWVEDNKARIKNTKVQFCAFKCRACEHLNIDTMPWLCHACGSPDVQPDELFEIGLEEASELLKSDFVCEVGGALQELCAFICEHGIQCMYYECLSGTDAEDEEVEEEVDETEEELGELEARE